MQAVQLPIIQGNGRLLEVHFPQPSSKCNKTNKNLIESSQFHAQWLWSNDPANFYTPSGQKKQSPGSYPGSLLQTATIIRRGNDELGLSSEIPPAPDLGGAHPLHITVLEEAGKKEQSTSRTRNKDSHSKDRDDSLVLYLEWTNGTKTFYDLEWLRQWAYDKPSLANGRLNREVTPKHTFIKRFANVKCADSERTNTIFERDSKTRLTHHKGLRHVDFCNHNKHGAFDLLDAIFMDGAALVTNAPPTFTWPDATVNVLGKALAGGLSHGNLYRNIFHVKEVKNSENIAYTREYLCPHQDLAYYECKPGLQLLHCVDDGGKHMEGGESILIDCMAAAYRFRELAPDLFRILTTCDATFVKEREGACMSYLRPHIQLRRQEHIDGGGYGGNADIDQEIIAVHWAPPFEGPLSVPPHLVEDYYKAYAAFELMLDCNIPGASRSLHFGFDDDLLIKLSEYAKEYTWEYRLKPGEVMIFNNTRMLHGRKEFCASPRIDHNDGVRHLAGAYTNIDDALNTYRILMQDMSINCNIPNVGNGTSSVLP